MANISVGWEVDGILTPTESVSAMLEVVPTKTIEHSGTFWTWEGKVIYKILLSPKIIRTPSLILDIRNTHGKCIYSAFERAGIRLAEISTAGTCEFRDLDGLNFP